MQTFIVLLRGINVSGQKKIKMIELREALERRGFNNVSTYIQSGNLILQHSKDKDEVRTAVRSCLLTDFGYEVPVIAYTPNEWETIYSKNPFNQSEEDQKGHYIVFLFENPDVEGVKALSQESFPNEEFHISTNCVYLNCHQGYGKAKCSNNFFENRLKVKATSRNLRTVRTLSKMASEFE